MQNRGGGLLDWTAGLLYIYVLIKFERIIIWLVGAVESHNYSFAFAPVSDVHIHIYMHREGLGAMCMHVSLS